MHISLDGFVAGKNGELDLFENPNEHLNFLNSLLDKADSIMLGRVTYEMFNDYWPVIETDQASSLDKKNYSQWYNCVTKIVLSKTLNEVQEKNTIVIMNDPISSIKELKNQSGKDILLFGSTTVGHLLAQENLIDEYWIFINPVVFGTGISMFDTNTKLTRLKLLETKTISNGEVALHYEVRN
jgi:dihydrofolate reductase